MSKNRLPRIDEAFEKINSFAKGGAKADQITNALIYMITKDKEPLNIVNKKGFQNLMKVIAPHYTLPSRKTVTKLVTSRYTKMKESYSSNLQKAVSYTLTCDNWTDCTFQSYLGVSIHYLSEDLQMKNGILGVFPLDKNHTAVYLKDSLTSVITDFGLDKSKIMAITSDGASNIRAATESLVGTERQIWCFAHFISHMVPKILNEMTELTKMIDIAREIIKIIRSVVACDELKKLQVADGKTEGTTLKFLLDVPTRWNSEFYMLERFLQLEEYIPGIMRKCRKTKFPDLLTCDQLEVLSEIVDLMRPVEMVIREISGSEYATASVIIPIISCLKKTLMAMEPGKDAAINFKTKLIDKINEQFAGIEKHKILAVSTILDPRFKRLHFENVCYAANACPHIDREIKSLGVKVIEERKLIQQKHADPCRMSLWKAHDDLVAKAVDENADDETLVSELRQYLKKTPIPRHEDPFKYWKSLQHSFPTLYELAIRYVSIISTSVPSERIFSEAGHTKTLDRNRLTGVGNPLGVIVRHALII
ncbi:zinc finger BED domain-containing protein 4 isoform X2 [Diachasma alloeum]|uniref:zinc finger BED domain-containing protein 4 isoform X2 n=1 Tax=Diachasma alloeum TaxID=454923 RepID=UPI0007382FC0|nr:zinc finger BED domain-containing protein 4 isoform X2 [Diachasma alloeum]